MHNVSHDYHCSINGQPYNIILIDMPEYLKHTNVCVGKALTIKLCILYTNIVIQRTLKASKNAESFTWFSVVQ